MHPKWTGDFSNGFDFALLTLPETANAPSPKLMDEASNSPEYLDSSLYGFWMGTDLKLSSFHITREGSLQLASFPSSQACYQSSKPDEGVVCILLMLWILHTQQIAKSYA